MPVYVSRQDLEAFAELLDARVNGPYCDRAKMTLTFVLPETGVKTELRVTAILNAQATPTGRHYGRTPHDTGTRFYGRADARGQGWNEVRLDNWAGQNFAHFGKGARSIDTWNEAKQLAALLTGLEVVRGYLGGSDDETKVTLV